LHHTNIHDIYLKEGMNERVFYDPFNALLGYMGTASSDTVMNDLVYIHLSSYD